MDKNVLIEQIVNEVLQELKSRQGIKVGISARHVHLSREDLDTLFGTGYQLTKLKGLMGDEFASNEAVTLVGPSLKSIENVRILGPVRGKTQVEISRTDAFLLKISPPVRPSGQVDASESIVVIGPKGAIFLKEGCIIANRHIHMTPKDALIYGLQDNDYVDVEIQSEKPTRFYNVQIRINEKYYTQMHIDTDDGNAAGIKDGDYVEIIQKYHAND